VKVGLVYDFRNPVAWERPAPDLYRALIEHAQEVERLGFDSLWISEHHFVDDGYSSAILPLAAALAAETRRIRIGTFVLLLPLHDPLRVAEAALAIDQLANGRFELGVGQGYRVEEYRGFCVERSERGRRMEEGLSVLQRAFTGDTFSFDGQFYRYQDVRLTPRALRGEIKIYSAARGAAGARRAARHNCHLLPMGDVSVYNAYAAELARLGKSTGPYDVVRFAPWFVTRDPERDRPRVEPHIRYQQTVYREWFDRAMDFPSDSLQAGGTADEYVFGTPSEVAAGLAQVMEEMPTQELLAWAVPPGADISLSLESARLFIQEVAPQLRTGNRIGTGFEVRD
jgi:alkanesulfonate monooxygenase SsuD/methylene tetrahydromethanopterin reductase-like flavin-dependent oxidoreductase (luciferase family)